MSFFSTDDTQDSPPPKKARINESRLDDNSEQFSLASIAPIDDSYKGI